MKKLLFLLPLALLFAGCWKYEAQYEGEYTDDGKGVDPPAPYAPTMEILTLQSGQVVLYDRTLARQKTLGGALPATIEKAAINFDHDRIAAKAFFEKIVVADTAGKVLATVPGSEYAVWFDWHPNGQTLYFVTDDNQLHLYGPTVPLAETNLNAVFPLGITDGEVGSVAVLADGSVLVGSRYQTWSGNEARLTLIGSGGKQEISLPVWQNVTWLRVDKGGTTANFGTGYDLYSVDLPGLGNLTDHFGDDWRVASPDGKSLAESTSSGLAVFLASGDSFSAGLSESLGGLDW